jgi:hypothetical protein
MRLLYLIEPTLEHKYKYCVFRILAIILFIWNTILETGFCLHLQAEPTHLGSVNISSPYLQTPASQQAQHKSAARVKIFIENNKTI